MATQPGVKRKLAAILSADVVGYSRLMQADEAATVAALKTCREVIAGLVARHGGRVVNAPGDALLADFASAVEAVAAAVEIQQAVEGRNVELAPERRMRLRIGVNLGDVIEEADGTVYGDGVNIAARLEALAEAGGICVSGAVHDAVEGKLDCGFDFLGERPVKNIAKPVRVYAVGAAGRPRADAAAAGHQDIRFCSARDGTSIAYAVAGAGPPLVKTANWLNHLEYDWTSPIWRHLLAELAHDHMLVRYDARGNGLSDWTVEDISFEAFVSDLETVVDACRLDRFPLLGISQGCAVSIAYAVRHPERVSKLVLYGGFARGRRKRGSQADIDQAEAMITLIRHSWGQDNPAIRQLFATLFLPDGTPAQVDWFNDLQRITTSPENAARIRTATNDIDVTALLA
ncbi:MAG TPA: alpha/beta fold hydrolase, partial [Alphaproteobacteria bacterium]